MEFVVYFFFDLCFFVSNLNTPFFPFSFYFFSSRKIIIFEHTPKEELRD